jgi:hypothetical protein
VETIIENNLSKREKSQVVADFNELTKFNSKCFTTPGSEILCERYQSTQSNIQQYHFHLNRSIAFLVFETNGEFYKLFYERANVRGPRCPGDLFALISGADEVVMFQRRRQD